MSAVLTGRLVHASYGPTTTSNANLLLKQASSLLLHRRLVVIVITGLRRLAVVAAMIAAASDTGIDAADVQQSHAVSADSLVNATACTRGHLALQHSYSIV
jgi:hypothetical protein